MTIVRFKSIFHILLFIIVLASLLGSARFVTPVYAATVTVTKTEDTNDGICDSDCSLREAIATAGVGDIISFDASLAGETIYLTSTLNLFQNITIDGSTLAEKITISGDSDNNRTGDVRVFSVEGSVTATLDSLIIKKGLAEGPSLADDVGGGIVNNGSLTIIDSLLSENSASNGGGGIYNYATLIVDTTIFTRNSAPGGAAILSISALTVQNSRFSNNSAGDTGGGGIASNGTLTVTQTTFSDNSSTASGGGIFVIGNTATIENSTFSDGSAQYGGGISSNTGTSLAITNSTFANNSASILGGGIYNGNTLTIKNSTLSGNSSAEGAGILNEGTLNYFNTIIANSSGSDCFNLGTIGTNTNNLVEDGACSSSLSGDPNLDVLDDNSGSTPTFALLPNSTAIDAGNDTACNAAPVNSLDQQGSSRPVGAHCDIGAYEYIPVFVVTKAADTNDGICNSDCSLREAITAANVNSGADTIRFNGDYTINLGSTLPFITDDLTINGRGHTIMIDGGTTYSFTDVQSGSLSLKALIIQNTSGIDGGAIVNHSTLTVIDSTFNSNIASNNAGGIYNFGNLIINSSTFANNSATSGGGAIKNDAGTLTIANSTFDTNSAATGGAIIALGGTTTITNTTFSSNSATTQAGGIYNNGTLNYANTIIANSSGGDCANDGTLGINTDNLVEDGSCSASLSGDPGLGTLSNNGGSTQTLALLAGSTAINAGSNDRCDLSIKGLDQRGVLRPQGSHCDIGAFEVVDTLVPTVLSIIRVSADPTAASSIDFTVTFSEFVTGVDMNDFSLTTTGLSGASISTVSGSGTSYTVTASTGSGSGTLRLDVINPISITDIFSNSLGSLPFTSGETYTIDRTAPTVTSIVRISADPTSASSVDFSVTFSEPVTDVDVFDFALTTTGLINTSISAVSGSGNSYTVTALTGYKSGTLRLDVSTTATITDLFSYSLVDLPFITGEVYTIEKTPIFIDVPFDYWSWQYIESIYNASITYGCSSNPLSYCPANSVTRAQMAVFLLKGIHGSSYIPPAVDSETGFTDVPTDYWAAAWIKQLAAEGITSGCDMEIYCPENPVTRDQMAIFLLKAKYGTSYTPPAVNSETGFTDVPSDYWAAAWIKQLAAEAITGGCGGGNYCPGDSVTRDQMAVFLQKTFGLPLP